MESSSYSMWNLSQEQTSEALPARNTAHIHGIQCKFHNSVYSDLSHISHHRYILNRLVRNYYFVPLWAPDVEVCTNLVSRHSPGMSVYHRDYP